MWAWEDRGHRDTDLRPNHPTARDTCGNSGSQPDDGMLACDTLYANNRYFIDTWRGGLT